MVTAWMMQALLDDNRQLLLAINKTLADLDYPPIYLVGGAIRNWLVSLGDKHPEKWPITYALAGSTVFALSSDLDFTLASGALAFARRLARELGGTFVSLDPDRDVARVVWQGRNLDFSGFREQATTIEEDLAHRDFTINAMALRLNSGGLAISLPTDRGPIMGSSLGPDLDQNLTGRQQLIDPVHGLNDLQAGIVRAVNPQVFWADPLRLLRAYRFQAILNFRLAAETVTLMRQALPAIKRVAAERTRAEMDAILLSPLAGSAVAAMATDGLLYQIIPELSAGLGLRQPDSHHLDVSEHGIETLRQMELVLARPERFFPQFSQEFHAYLSASRHPHRSLTLRWAALLHDLGKPATHDLSQARRITFYNHDRVGAELCRQLSVRLRFSRERSALLQLLVANHMWPFHLNNTRLKTANPKGLAQRGLSPRACLKLARGLGRDLPALFLLAMADSLASRGPGKPSTMEQNLAELFAEVMTVIRARIDPVLNQPPLLNGKDLQDIFAMKPGPVFKTILNNLESAQVEGKINSRAEALAWVRNIRDIEDKTKCQT